MSATKDRKIKEFKSKQNFEGLEKFNKSLEDSSPPVYTTTKSLESVFFLQKASNISKSSFSGFGGLDRTEIKLSFENFKTEFTQLIDFEDIGWAIEFLDESLKAYFSKQTPTKED